MSRSHPQKHVRQIFDYAVGAARALGVSVHIENGGKHHHLVFEGRGTRRIQPVSSSPRSEGSAVKFAQRDVRRVLKEMVGV